MTSQVVQGMGILMGRYGHLKGKNTPLKNRRVFVPAQVTGSSQPTSKTELNFWLILPAKQHQYPCSGPSKVYQGCHDLNVIVDLPIRLTEKLKQMFRS